MKFKLGPTKQYLSENVFSSSATLGLRSTLLMLICGVPLAYEMFEIAAKDKVHEAP